MLRIADRWIWDSWMADDGEYYHLFYLQAPRALGDAGLRHTNATVGHARSTDLVAWEVLPDALGPRAGAWDDLAIWTGSVVQADDGSWLMFYTAISTTRGHVLKDQRIGVVASDDLVTWHRTGDRPTLEVDTRWYRSLDEDPTASETLRDPLVFKDKGGDGWHMIYCARAAGGRRNDDGVLGHAWSEDLVHWEARPPISAPGTGFGQLEVAQIKVIDGAHVLVFTCHPQEMTEERIARSGHYCTWSVAGDATLGPWDIDTAQPFTAEPDLFAAPLVQQRDGSWALVGFRNLEPRGTLSFHIMDPIPVHLVDGVLTATDDYHPHPIDA